jgi:hypothetical protein
LTSIESLLESSQVILIASMLKSRPSRWTAHLGQLSTAAQKAISVRYDLQKPESLIWGYLDFLQRKPRSSPLNNIIIISNSWCMESLPSRPQSGSLPCLSRHPAWRLHSSSIPLSISVMKYPQFHFCP